MKKISLVVALFVAIGAFAQKHGPEKESFTVEQKTQLMIKKMSIELDLTSKQVTQITPIVVDKATKMEARKAEFKGEKGEHKQERKMLSSDEKFKMAMAHLEEQEALQNKMKNILNKDQYATWKKMHKKHSEKRNKPGMKHAPKKQCDNPKECDDKKQGDHKKGKRHEHDEPEA